MSSMHSDGFWEERIDPGRIRFAYSRIKPVFSGCGRRLDDTIGDIRHGKLAPDGLPRITGTLHEADEIVLRPLRIAL